MEATPPKQREKAGKDREGNTGRLGFESASFPKCHARVIAMLPVLAEQPFVPKASFAFKEASCEGWGGALKMALPPPRMKRAESQK